MGGTPYPENQIRFGRVGGGGNPLATYAKCLFGLIGGIILFYFSTKKMDVDSKFFTFFKPKNDLLVQFLDPTFFRTEEILGPQKKNGDLFFLKKNSARGVPPPMVLEIGRGQGYGIGRPGYPPPPSPAQNDKKELPKKIIPHKSF